MSELLESGVQPEPESISYTTELEGSWPLNERVKASSLVTMVPVVCGVPESNSPVNESVPAAGSSLSTVMLRGELAPLVLPAPSVICAVSCTLLEKLAPGIWNCA